ncbi:MAG: ISNCY family transposase [Thermoplasmata archaeon YP2-bin.285]|uniref:ISNCY family transposase n=1 Tax=Candidatus Sysuiplasma superficiale TaxID=2823368 RepID=A0A8J8CDP6_9ARCH|nr:ISNCY family transposase [Candidatus Sysuiplasma superficiale]
MLTNEQFDRFHNEFDFLVKKYREQYSRHTGRDWSAYERSYEQRIRHAAAELYSVVKSASSIIFSPDDHMGRPPKVTPEQKVVMLLLKEIFSLSNRKMSGLLSLFGPLTDIDICYKTVERAYSSMPVRLIIHNMFVLLASGAGGNLTGDGTGYSLSITRHYRSMRENSNGNCMETNPDHRLFVYAFAILDLGTNLYVTYGVSMKSEKDAYREALRMLGITVRDVESIRLDQYYGSQSTLDDFSEGTKVFVIPRSNTTIRGSPAWKELIGRLMDAPMEFLSEYYRRENSESQFSADKRTTGWRIQQRREDRIRTAAMCKGTWHNLFNMTSG